jgi:hypothetical protein
MLPNYQFNEQLKRFEPLEKKCSYCIEHNENSSIDTAYYIDLYKEQDRTNIIVYRSVKFQKISIGVTRCNSCKNFHIAAKGTSKMYAWGLAVVVFISSIVLLKFMGFIIGFLGGMLVGFLGSYLLEKKFVEDKGILTMVEGAKTNPVIQEFVISGWSFTQPSA